MDKRLLQIAKNIVNTSLKLKSEETLILQALGKEQFELAQEIANYCTTKNINVISEFLTLEEFNSIWKNITPEQLEQIIQREISWHKKADATCILRSNTTLPLSETSSKAYNKYILEVHQNYRLKKRWLLTKVPCRLTAKQNGMDFDKQYEMYLQACSLDYNKLSSAMDNLYSLLTNGEKVKIIAPNTYVEFSIKNMPAVKCIGERNLPDGELYTAPIKDNVNGYITYNVPSVQNGILHKNIFFEFKNGKIIKATSDHTPELNQILDSDEGARYIGEFSFGLNPLILTPCNNILYDEKISGSIHLTPGSAYERCDNGNISAIHWDLIQIQREDYGGGEIFIDDVLIRKNGLFVPPNLQCLNPENLLEQTNPNNNLELY